MRLYITIRTSTKDLVIDYITVRLASGKTVSINFDESNYDYKKGCINARYRGIHFGESEEEPFLETLSGMKVLDVGVYSPTEKYVTYRFLDMMFDDNGEIKVFQNAYYRKSVRVYCTDLYPLQLLTTEELEMGNKPLKIRLYQMKHNEQTRPYIFENSVYVKEKTAVKSRMSNTNLYLTECWTSIRPTTFL